MLANKGYVQIAQQHKIPRQVRIPCRGIFIVSLFCQPGGQLVQGRLRLRLDGGPDAHQLLPDRQVLHLPQDGPHTLPGGGGPAAVLHQGHLPAPVGLGPQVMEEVLHGREQAGVIAGGGRSEERRVGKEGWPVCRSRWAPYP